VYNVVTMSNTVLHVKLDPKLKKQAQEAAESLGLPLSTVVSANLRQFVRTRSVTISDQPRLKPEVVEELLKGSEEAKKGINVSPEFSDAKDAIKWLKSEL